jgi:hypothetical protein
MSEKWRCTAKTGLKYAALIEVTTGSNLKQQYFQETPKTAG